LAAAGKALYHAAAVVASNYLSALYFVAERLGAESGLGDQARQVLAPLMQATLARAGALGLPAALTGPIERGDQATVGRHLAALRARGADDRDAVLALYAGCGLVAARMAVLKRRSAAGDGDEGTAVGPKAAPLPEPWAAIEARLWDEFEVSR
ncbi:MAG TPA: DUF2520 domain-containing protein, partial [Limnochordia bacterium]|nr:DUF2520 domain-containing protein [Limnochordia bacterium]